MTDNKMNPMTDEEKLTVANLTGKYSMPQEDAMDAIETGQEFDKEWEKAKKAGTPITLCQPDGEEFTIIPV